MTNNDIVINKLTQILSYLRQGGKRDRKQRKKDKAAGKATFGDEKLRMVPTDIYSGLVPDFMVTSRSKSDGQKERHGGYERDRQHGGGERGNDGDSTRRSLYFVYFTSTLFQ